MELARLGLFWEGNGGGEFWGGKGGAIVSGREMDGEAEEREEEKEEREWEKEVVGALESLKTVHVVDG
jgi:nuclear pore complex protein Nup107